MRKKNLKDAFAVAESNQKLAVDKLFPACEKNARFDICRAEKLNFLFSTCLQFGDSAGLSKLNY